MRVSLKSFSSGFVEIGEENVFFSDVSAMPMNPPFFVARCISFATSGFTES